MDTAVRTKPGGRKASASNCARCAGRTLRPPPATTHHRRLLPSVAGIAKAARPAWRAWPGAASDYSERLDALGTDARAWGGDLGLGWRPRQPLPPPGLSFPALSMKAFSPVRSVRKNSLSDHSLGISRSKTPVDDPMSLLYNMNDCYSKLKELVPSIPQNKKVSKMEILQHVIDYILDLQIALDSHPTIVSLHHQRPGQSQASRTPLTTLNTDISILSLQASEFPSELMSNDSKALCG
ncbi:DNA-binding protein inhibitor ID-2 [Camelus dromedarius]|nr:DNA-binding protein inhibitor ID-2 [Camelus dromedarius]KAB1267369.1 DNA-binding protein inhibitor ID-2 [Camelus dromedarius]